MRLASIQLLIQQCEEQIKFAERPSRVNSLKLLEITKDYVQLVIERPPNNTVEDRQAYDCERYGRCYDLTAVGCNKQCRSYTPAT